MVDEMIRLYEHTLGKKHMFYHYVGPFCVGMFDTEELMVGIWSTGQILYPHHNGLQNWDSAFTYIEILYSMKCMEFVHESI